MARRTARVLAWGLVGILVAAALILGSFRVAGTSLTDPASAVRISGTVPTPDLHEGSSSRSPTRTPSPADEPPSPTPTSDDLLAPSPAGSAEDPADGGTERGDD